MTRPFLNTLIAAALLAAAVVADDQPADSGKPTPPEDKTQKMDSTTKAPEWITKKSGLKVRDMKIGEGLEVIPGSMVEVHYTGWLDAGDGKRGKKFDSSHDRGKPYPTRIPGQLIAGWNEGIIGMKEGGKRELWVPPALGYGARDKGVIPPNSTLIFEVELVKVTKQ